VAISDAEFHRLYNIIIGLYSLNIIWRTKRLCTNSN